MKDLSIDNPCPVLLMRMKKTESGFYCSSCARNVIDYRNKNEEEIRANLKTGSCGIFDVAQLSAQRKMSFKRSLAFYTLACISFLGFNVQPLNAQTRDSTRVMNDKTSGHLTAKEYREKKKELKSRKRGRGKFWKRKKHKYVVGYF